MWREQARAHAFAAGIPPEEVDRLLEWGVGWSRLNQRLGSSLPSTQELDRIQSLWRYRLEEKVPLQYLMGSATWRDLELQVSPAVLIPRPETELLVEIALSWLQSQPEGGVWLDMGTGSGALAIALAREAPQITRIYGVDLSAAALSIAQANARRWQVENRIVFRQGSWFEALRECPALWGTVQGLVANPPYIPSAQIPQLQPEVYYHEPRLALEGGETGVEAIQILIESAPRMLGSGGFWGIEIMQGQAAWVQQCLATTQQYTQIQVHQDLSGIERFVSAQIDYSGL